jgi:hypothetical protein
MSEFQLRLTADQHSSLKGHLFPGDDLEAVALILCGRREGSDNHILLGREIIKVPHEHCDRRVDAEPFQRLQRKGSLLRL